MQSQTDDLKNMIERNYGFKKDLIEDAKWSGGCRVKFTVNGIRYSGSFPFYGAVPRLCVDGYTTPYRWHGTPVTEEYFKKNIEGRKLRLKHCIDAETDDWELMDVTFSNETEAVYYIIKLERPEEYSYDICD